MLIRVVAMFLSLCACAAPVYAAQAEKFPIRPVRVVVPSTPGGGLDVMARIMAPQLIERWGQQVVIDNRAGAGGISQQAQILDLLCDLAGDPADQGFIIVCQRMGRVRVQVQGADLFIHDRHRFMEAAVRRKFLRIGQDGGLVVCVTDAFAAVNCIQV